jgi:hypothetical protein
VPQEVQDLNAKLKGIADTNNTQTLHISDLYHIYILIAYICSSQFT